MSFKSDNIDTKVPYAFIPTAGIVTIVGQYSSLNSYVDIGLIPCDGRSLNTTTYQNLFNIIGYTYGGSGSSFNVPNLIDSKRVVLASNNNSVIGTKINTTSHNHTSSSTAVTSDTNADSFTHYHSTSFNTGNWSVNAHNTHNYVGTTVTYASGAPASGLRAKNDGTSTAASVGHTHNNWTFTPGGTGSGAYGASHAHGGSFSLDTNSSTTAEGQHTHTVTPSTAGVLNNSSGEFYPPVYDVLFLIKI